MLALCLVAHAFSTPTVPLAEPVARSSPLQMMEMPSRRAILSAAALLAVLAAASAKPEDYVGGCAHFEALEASEA